MSKFEKISFDQYKIDCYNLGHRPSDDELRREYEAIKLPTRATSGSAGYDFYSPWQFDVSSNPVHIPTGIRCLIDDGYFLLCCPKSGLGFRYGIRLCNTIGIIDSDYSSSDNEGHIHGKFISDTPFTVNRGQKFMQGIFVPYGVADDDQTNGKRNGGFGSTGES